MSFFEGRRGAVSRDAIIERGSVNSCNDIAVTRTCQFGQDVCVLPRAADAADVQSLQRLRSLRHETDDEPPTIIAVENAGGIGRRHFQ
jgi:hypothetical protein